MMFRAADGMRFVGTPTVGADGDVTNFTIPGGMTLAFTGANVRWPDGRPTQRVGLQPDLRIEPTAHDIAQGKDVVLLTALRAALRNAGVSAAEVAHAVAAEEARERDEFRALPASP